MPSTRFRWSVRVAVSLCLAHAGSAGAAAPVAAPGGRATGFPITVRLDRPQHVTVVIEDESGSRVRNLVSETRLPAGANTLTWDGYDDGRAEGPDGRMVRRRVEPGTYRARGLTHDGLATVYELTAYSGGMPPWATRDGTGGWLADHSSPLGATFIPEGSAYGNGKPQVLLTSLVSEAGRNMVWVGLDGQTYQRRSIWGWDGALAAATDVGPSRVREHQAYVLMCWGKDGDVILRAIAGEGGKEIARYKPKTAMPKEPRELGLALSVRDALAVIAVPLDDAVVFVDVSRGSVLGTATVTAPKGVLLDPQGRLLVSTAKTVRRYALGRAKPGAAPVLDAGSAIIADLEDPRTIQTDAAGRELYVADWGTSSQVKVYSAAGARARTIGRPGGFQVGRYDEQRMHRPCGLALDNRGQLWVAEADWLPKRISLWDAATGRLKRAWYGPPHYGGGGTVDPADATRFFYSEFGGLLEFKLDWQRGTSTLVAIPIRYDVQGFDKMPYDEFGLCPERPVRVDNRLYLVGGYQSGLRANDCPATFLYDEKTRTARPVCHVGSFRRWESVRTSPMAKALQDQGGIYEPFIAWTDLNADGKVTLDEFAVRRFAETVPKGNGERTPLFGFRSFMALPDLSLCGSWSLRVPAPTFRADGTPLYDLSKATFAVPPGPEQHWAEDGHDGIALGDGSWLQGFRGWKDGRWIWSYPATWETSAPPQYPGHVVEPTRLMGPPFKAARGEAGEMFCYNGERGNMYLMTGDGLFVQTLGGHMATSDLFRFPEAKRGMDVSGHGFEDEHFHPTITGTRDGIVYMVAGKEHSSVFRIDGFDTVRRRTFGSVSLSASALAALPPSVVVPGRKQGRQTLEVAVLDGRAPVVDGRVGDDWGAASWATIGSASSAALAVSGGRLYAAWRTGDPQALLNTATDPPYAFKGGGCVDVMLGPAGRPTTREPVAGDLRLLVTTVKGKKLAMLYRAVVPGASQAVGRLFESPVGKVRFDEVRDVSNEVELASAGGEVEISVPLVLLGIAGRAGEQVIGDLGILRGDGVQTVQRCYWNNMDSMIVSDVPSEARLRPDQWGTLQLVSRPAR